MASPSPIVGAVRNRSCRSPVSARTSVSRGTTHSRANRKGVIHEPRPQWVIIRQNRVTLTKGANRNLSLVSHTLLSMSVKDRSTASSTDHAAVIIIRNCKYLVSGTSGYLRL